jgi:hypothetical protein
LFLWRRVVIGGRYHQFDQNRRKPLVNLTRWHNIIQKAYGMVRDCWCDHRGNNDSLHIGAYRKLKIWIILSVRRKRRIYE